MTQKLKVIKKKLKIKSILKLECVQNVIRVKKNTQTITKSQLLIIYVLLFTFKAHPCWIGNKVRMAQKKKITSIIIK